MGNIFEQYGGDIISGGLGLATGVINTLVGVNQAEKNREFNAREAQKQRDWQEYMWNQANKFNSPLQQRQRLAEAGLNPNLVYGDGAKALAAQVGSGSAASSSSTAKGAIENPVITAMSMRRLQAEIDNIQADELLKREEAKNKQTEREGRELENMWNRDSYQLRLDKLQAEATLQTSLEWTEESKRNLIQEEIYNYKKTREQIDHQIQNQDRLTDQEIKKMQAEIDNSTKIAASVVVKNKADARKANADAWLATVEASIKDDPRYKDAQVHKAIFDAYKALQDGSEKEIHNAFRRIEFTFLPKPGEPGYLMKQYVSRFVDPVTSSLGKILGGSATLPLKP